MIIIRNIPSQLKRKFNRYFTAREFRCHCGKCKLTFIHPTGIYLLIALRRLYGKPIRFTSAYRCQEHNRGVENSADYSDHMAGGAWDIPLSVNRIDRERLIKFAKALFPYVKVYRGFIHCGLKIT